MDALLAKLQGHLISNDWDGAKEVLAGNDGIVSANLILECLFDEETRVTLVDLQNLYCEYHP